MAKISGFFMSTLLIVLCLWINVCHYPDATVALDKREQTLVVPCEAETSEPANAPETAPPADGSNDAEPSETDATLAETIVKPAWVDVSASRSDVLPEPVAATPSPVSEPAAPPVGVAEIDDAPEAESALANAAPSPAPPVVSDRADAADSNRSVARSSTKPRGAKYVRVPDVEIDAFVGGVRTAGARPVGGARVVGATRAEQTLRVPDAVR